MVTRKKTNRNQYVGQLQATELLKLPAVEKHDQNIKQCEKSIKHSCKSGASQKTTNFSISLIRLLTSPNRTLIEVT